jgi:hypothetical protein
MNAVAYCQDGGAWDIIRLVRQGMKRRARPDRVPVSDATARSSPADAESPPDNQDISQSSHFPRGGKHELSELPGRESGTA